MLHANWLTSKRNPIDLLRKSSNLIKQTSHQLNRKACLCGIFGEKSICDKNSRKLHDKTTVSRLKSESLGE